FREKCRNACPRPPSFGRNLDASSPVSPASTLFCGHATSSFHRDLPDRRRRYSTTSRKEKSAALSLDERPPAVQTAGAARIIGALGDPGNVSSMRQRRSSPRSRYPYPPRIASLSPGGRNMAPSAIRSRKRPGEKGHRCEGVVLCPGQVPALIAK